jgi:glycosyltransferase involved in cell wall biosynthesis
MFTQSTEGKVMSRPIEVLYLASEMSSLGGAERVNFLVLTGLDRTRFRPRALFVKQASEIGQRLAQSGVPVETLHAYKRTHFPLVLIKTLSYLRACPVDIVFTAEDRIGMALATILRKRGVIPRYVLCFHNTRLHSGLGRIIHPLAVQSADRIVMLSERNKQFWLKYYLEIEDKITIINNGIMIGDAQPVSPEHRRQRRKELGLPPDKYTVGLVTFFKQFKNLPAFVRVARLVTDAGIDAQFVLVGDGPERPTVEGAIADLSVAPHFLLPGTTTDSRKWYEAFDVALMTSSSSEAFPITLLEAMSVGLPVVATNVAGIPDIVIHGQTGFTAEPTDIQQLAHYLVVLARDFELRQQMGRAGFQRVLTEFNADLMVQRYAQLFEELVRF